MASLTFSSGLSVAYSELMIAPAVPSTYEDSKRISSLSACAKAGNSAFCCCLFKFLNKSARLSEDISPTISAKV